MPPRILIAEDEPELLRAISLRLQAAGFTCETASNGVEALEKVQQGRPDLIIADLLMPEMDGYTMIHHLKSDVRTSTIPLMVLTAVPEHARIHRAEELEGARIMHKPFDSGELILTVRELLDMPPSGGARHG